MCEKFERFNAELVGEDSVFPRRNSAPKYWSNSSLIRLKQLRDEFTTGNKPKSLPTIKKGDASSWQTCHLQSA